MSLSTPHPVHETPGPSLRRGPTARTMVVVIVGAIVTALAGYVMSTEHGRAAGFHPHPGNGLNLLYSISGFLVGALVGLTGVGGGSLMTPLLVLLFGFHPGTAVGTDLLYASATKAVGTAVHGANKTVDWGVVGRMSLGSVPASGLSLWLLYSLGVHGDKAGKVISVTLGLALILTAVTLLFRNRLLTLATEKLPAPSDRMTAILTTILGAVLGVLITLSSVGAGAIGVTVLIFLYPRLATARIVGTDIAHAVPLTLIAGLGHWWLGSVNFALLGSLLLGSIPGIMIGSHFSARIPDRVLRPILATTLAVVGGKLAF